MSPGVSGRVGPLTRGGQTQVYSCSYGKRHTGYDDHSNFINSKGWLSGTVNLRCPPCMSLGEMNNLGEHTEGLRKEAWPPKRVPAKPSWGQAYPLLKEPNSSKCCIQNCVSRINDTTQCPAKVRDTFHCYTFYVTSHGRASSLRGGPRPTPWIQCQPLTATFYLEKVEKRI